MRIALFAETFLPKIDGVVNTTCRLLEHLSTRRHTSLMFAPQGAPSRYADTPIVGLPSVSVPLYPELRVVPPLVSVGQQLAEFQPDIVHLINPASLGLVGLRHARALDVPIVASYQTDLPGYLEHYGYDSDLLRASVWAYFRWLHNQADLNLCPSTSTLAELEAQSFQRVEVWGRGVDTQRFSPHHRSEEWRQRLSGGHPEVPLLLYVGRLAKEKRARWLQPMIEMLPDARLAIVGDGPMRAELERNFADTSTLFTGYLHGEDLSRAYASADLFVFPSASETFGNVMLEAMASGLPVIAPHAGGPMDCVMDGENGFLFDPDALEEMVALVRWLVSHPLHVQRLGASARMYAETQGWEEKLDDLMDKYAALIEHRAYMDRARTMHDLAVQPSHSHSLHHYA